MNRSESYDEYLSAKLQKPSFARGFLIALTETEDPLSLEDALRRTITRMGLKEFAKLAGVPQSNVSDYVRGKRKLKFETLNTYLKPFKLRAKLVLEKAS